jgi:hypothetical protein
MKYLVSDNLYALYIHSITRTKSRKKKLPEKAANPQQSQTPGAPRSAIITRTPAPTKLE